MFQNEGADYLDPFEAFFQKKVFENRELKWYLDVEERDALVKRFSEYVGVYDWSTLNAIEDHLGKERTQASYPTISSFSIQIATMGQKYIRFSDGEKVSLYVVGAGYKGRGQELKEIREELDGLVVSGVRERVVREQMQEFFNLGFSKIQILQLIGPSPYLDNYLDNRRNLMETVDKMYPHLGSYERGVRFVSKQDAFEEIGGVMVPSEKNDYDLYIVDSEKKLSQVAWSDPIILVRNVEQEME